MFTNTSPYPLLYNKYNTYINYTTYTWNIQTRGYTCSLLCGSKSIENTTLSPLASGGASFRWRMRTKM